MEKCVHTAMLEFCTGNNLLSANQFGFLLKSSTTSQLICALNDWTNYLDNGDSVDVIYLDFKNAFDKVPHNLLLLKLFKLGFAGKLHAWLSNYLLFRFQRVLFNGSDSNFVSVKSGVPQGSILGPLLFILYVNDLPLSVGANVSALLFADDAKCYKSISNNADRLCLQNALDNLYLWCVEWRMLLNYDKCVVLHLGHSNSGYDYSINGHMLISSFVIKDLGVIMSSNLRFTDHINSLCKKAYFRLHLINTCFINRSSDFRVFLYKTYVRPILEYSSVVWSPHHKFEIDLVKRVQRSFTKTLLPYVDYDNRLAELNLESLFIRRIKFDLIFVCKMLHNLVNLDANVYFLFPPLASLRGNSFKLHHSFSRLDIRKYFFVNRVVHVWNKLPNNICGASSLNAFKKLLNTLPVNFFTIN